MLTKDSVKFHWCKIKLPISWGANQPLMPCHVRMLSSGTGTFSQLTLLTGILTALFYGSLSNSWGRRFVMMLSITGQVLALAWIVSIGQSRTSLIVLVACLRCARLLQHQCASRISMAFLTILTNWRWRKTGAVDAVHQLLRCGPMEEEVRSGTMGSNLRWLLRTRLFSFLHASEGIAGLIGYPISSALMEYRLWAPFSLAMMIFMVKYAVLWYTPETSLYLTDEIAKAPVDPEPYFASGMEGSRTEYLTQPASKTSPTGGFKPWWDGLTPRIQTSTLWTFFGHRGLNVVFGCFIVTRISFASESFVSQYASEILHTKLSATFWLRSLGPLSMLFLFTIFLPLLTRSMESPGKEMWVIRGSLMDLVVGFLILWRGRSLFALCIGTFTLRLTACLTCIRLGSSWPRGRIGSRNSVARSVHRGRDKSCHSLPLCEHAWFGRRSSRRTYPGEGVCISWSRQATFGLLFSAFYGVLRQRMLIKVSWNSRDREHCWLSLFFKNLHLGVSTEIWKWNCTTEKAQGWLRNIESLPELFQVDWSLDLWNQSWSEHRSEHVYADLFHQNAIHEQPWILFIQLRSDASATIHRARIYTEFLDKGECLFLFLIEFLEPLHSNHIYRDSYVCGTFCQIRVRRSSRSSCSFYATDLFLKLYATKSSDIWFCLQLRVLRKTFRTNAEWHQTQFQRNREDFVQMCSRYIQLIR